MLCTQTNNAPHKTYLGQIKQTDTQRNLLKDLEVLYRTGQTKPNHNKLNAKEHVCCFLV